MADAEPSENMHAAGAEHGNDAAEAAAGEGDAAATAAGANADQPAQASRSEVALARLDDALAQLNETASNMYTSTGDAGATPAPSRLSDTSLSASMMHVPDGVVQEANDGMHDGTAAPVRGPTPPPANAGDAVDPAATQSSPPTSSASTPGGAIAPAREQDAQQAPAPLPMQETASAVGDVRVTRPVSSVQRSAAAGQLVTRGTAPRVEHIVRAGGTMAGRAGPNHVVTSTSASNIRRSVLQQQHSQPRPCQYQATPHWQTQAAPMGTRAMPQSAMHAHNTPVHTAVPVSTWTATSLQSVHAHQGAPPALRPLQQSTPYAHPPGHVARGQHAFASNHMLRTQPMQTTGTMGQGGQMPDPRTAAVQAAAYTNAAMASTTQSQGRMPQNTSTYGAMHVPYHAHPGNTTYINVQGVDQAPSPMPGAPAASAHQTTYAAPHANQPPAVQMPGAVWLGGAMVSNQDQMNAILHDQHLSFHDKMVLMEKLLREQDAAQQMRREQEAAQIAAEAHALRQQQEARQRDVFNAQQSGVSAAQHWHAQYHGQHPLLRGVAASNGVATRAQADVQAAQSGVPQAHQPAVNSGVVARPHMTSSQLTHAFARKSSAVLKAAWTCKDTKKTISFDGSASQHPGLMTGTQHAMRTLLAYYAGAELNHRYHFREAPPEVQDQLYPGLCDAMHGTAATWVQAAEDHVFLDVDGRRIMFPTKFMELIAYCDYRFDPLHANNQALNALHDAVLLCKYDDMTKEVPFDLRIEGYMARLMPLLASHASFKGVSPTEALKDQQIQQHVGLQLPFYFKDHVGLLANPSDVEAEMAALSPRLRMEYNFAKGKRMPLTVEEFEGNVKEDTTKQYGNRQRPNTKRRDTDYLNVNLADCTYFGQPRVCWFCGKGHAMRRGECSEAEAKSDDNTRKGLEFKEANRAAVKDWQKTRDEDRRAADARGHQNSEPCRLCGDAKHAGKCKVDGEASQMKAFMASFKSFEQTVMEKFETLEAAEPVETDGSRHSAHSASRRRPAGGAGRGQVRRAHTTTQAAFASDVDEEVGDSGDD